MTVLTLCGIRHNLGFAFKGYIDGMRNAHRDMDMKKILIISTTGIGYEGISSVIYNYCSHMDRNGLQFTFLSPWKVLPDRREDFEKLGRLWVVSDRKKKPVAYARDLFALLKREKFDVIHIHGNSGTMLLDTVIAKCRGVRKVIVHGHSTACSHTFANRLLKRPMMGLADICLTCSEEAGKWLYGNRKYTVIHNGIDVGQFQYNPTVRDEVRKEFGVVNRFVVGHAGYFKPVKNQMFLIEVFRELKKKVPEACLLLIGEGQLMEAARNRVKELNMEESVIFAGRRRDMQRMYQMMDVFVFPSLFEGLGMVMIEAQMTGLPCIASTNVPRETKIHSQCFYLNLEQPISDWVHRLEVCKEVCREELQKECREKEAKYDIAKQAEKLRKLYLDNH